MFSVYHFIWIFISLALIVTSLILLKKYKPSLDLVLTVACVVCVLSEFIKVFSSIDLIPAADGTDFYP